MYPNTFRREITSLYLYYTLTNPPQKRGLGKSARHRVSPRARADSADACSNSSKKVEGGASLLQCFAHDLGRFRP